MTVALVTDSNAMLPPEVRERFAIRVVPLTVVLDGAERHEGVDLTTDEFYERLAVGATVSTAAPSPGDYLAVYQAAVDAGATAICSVHVGATFSATVQAATLAAEEVDVPVDVVDTGTASFGVGACVWAAADALAADGARADAVAAAERVASSVRTVFVVGGPELARRGGRLGVDDTGGSLPVIATGPGGEVATIATVASAPEAVDLMVDHVVAGAQGGHLRVGVGDARVPELAERMADALRDRDAVDEVVRYEVGPSVGAHTGAGTVGAVFFPR